MTHDIYKIEKTTEQGRPNRIIYDLRDNNAPRNIRITEHGNIYGSQMCDATHTLVDIINSRLTSMTIVYDLLGTASLCRLLPGTTKTYVYLDLRQWANPISAGMIALISSAFTDHDVYYNDPTSLDNIKLNLPVIKTWRGCHLTSKLPKSAISGHHHIHYTAQEIWDTLQGNQLKQASAALGAAADATTTFTGGLMLWLSQLTRQQFDFIRSTDLLRAANISEFAKLGKAISVGAKALQNLHADDLRPLFEIDVLVNRVTGAIDWKKEMDHRVNPDMALLSEDLVYSEACRLFKMADHHKVRPRRFTWNKFWRARWQWSAAGSVHSQYKQDDQYIFKKPRDLNNKFITLNAMPSRLDIQTLLRRRSEIHAWSSTKYEWGKQRAIYGCDLTSYILTHFAFFNCEDTLPNMFPVGSKARPSYVAAKVEAVLSGKLPFCIDFEDFNSQHSSSSMQAVMRAWLDTNRDHLSPEQLEAGYWAVQSAADVTIHDPQGLNIVYKTKGTLMSGWRLTSFVNSVLNYIYTKALNQGAKMISPSVHNGDDVLLGTNDLSILGRVLKNAEKYNIRLAPAKCAFGGIAEFLRVDHERGGHGQYLTRNIATLMHGRIESKMAISLTDIIEANEMRLTEFLIRGGDINTAVALRHTYCVRVSHLFRVDIDNLYKIITSHRVVGGISTDKNSDIDIIIDQTDYEVDFQVPDLKGTQDYAEALASDLELQDHLDALKKRIDKATLDAVSLVRRENKFSANCDLQQYVVYRAIYGAYRDLQGNTIIGKALLTGFLVDVLGTVGQCSTLLYMLQAARDKVKYLSIVL